MSATLHPDCSPIFEEMLGHFLKLPSGAMVREVWHSHARKHLNWFLTGRDFADRAKTELGYLIPHIYSEHLQSIDYRIRWLVIEDAPQALEAFGRVFDHFNLYTTLNRYPLAYALARLKVMMLEYRLRLAELNRHVPAVAAGTQALKEKLAAATEAVPLDCFVDLAFDFDIGAGKGLESLDAAIPFVLKLTAFCERYGIPHELYFSGGRGFHVVIPHEVFGQTPAQDNHLINRKLADLIQEETGELHFDPAIYSNRRQFRLPNSRHQKSGLYKIALTPEDLRLGEAHIQEKAKTRGPAPVRPSQICEYLCGLYALASGDIRSRPRYEVKPQNVSELQAARQSQPRIVADRKGMPPREYRAAIGDLVHPPCIRQAFSVGVPDTTLANRNQVTVLLASYFKAIGRSQDETTGVLVRHALTVLAPFSHSGPREIENSTRSATATVFRDSRYRFNCQIARRLGFDCNDTCEIFSRYRESAISRRLHRAPDTISVNPSGPLFQDVSDLRDDLARQVEDYIADVKSGKYEGGRIPPLLVRAPAGSGKTVTVFNKLAAMDLRTLWVATRLDLFDNIPAHLKAKWRRIEGRHGGVTLPSGEELPATCLQPEVARNLRERRLNVNEHLCRRCVHRSDCDYFRQFRDKQRNFFVQQPMYLHKVKDYAHEFGVVVFDEDIMAQFVESVRVRPHHVRLFKEMLTQLAEDLDFAHSYDEADELRPLLCFLDCLHKLLSDDRVSRPITGEVLHRRLAETYQAAALLFPPSNPFTLNEAIRDIPYGHDEIAESLHFDPYGPRDQIPYQFLNVLLPVLRYELFERKATSNLSRLRFETQRLPDKEDEASGKRRFQNLLEITVKSPPPALPGPTIILDATGKPEIYEKLFGVRPILYAPRMTFENQVTQVYSASGSYGSLRNAFHRSRMLEVLKHFLAEEPRTLVICKQGMKEAVSAILPPEAAVTHFYGNRGSNVFQDFKRAIVFGMPGMTPDTVLRYAGAFYYQENLSTDTEEQVRVYAGKQVGVKVLAYKEPLIQAIAETAREDEVLQSIHRIRPGLDRTKDIVVITNLVLTEMPVAELVSVDELLGKKTQARTDRNLEALVRLTQQQFRKLGFVSPARTLWPLVSGGPPDPEAGLQLPRSTFYSYKDRVREQCGLRRFEMLCLSPKGKSKVEVWGEDAVCLESARHHFGKHPSCQNEEFSFMEQENQANGQGDDDDGARPDFCH